MALAAKKGDKLVLLGFTGIRLAEVEVAKATKTELTVIKANGDEMVFDRKTGVQTNVAEGKEKYANKLVDPADAPAPKAKKAKPAKKAAPKKEEPEVEEEDEEEEEEEAPKPKKKPAKGKKKPAKKVEVEEDDEDDEDDDEDYEEM